MFQREADPLRVCEGGTDVTVAAYLIFSKKESENVTCVRQKLTGTGNNRTNANKKRILIHISIKNVTYF